MKFNDHIESILKLESSAKFDEIYKMLKRYSAGDIRKRYSVFSDVDVDTMAHDVAVVVVMKYKMEGEIGNWRAYTGGVIRNVVNLQLKDLYNKRKFEVTIHDIKNAPIPSNSALYDIHHTNSSENYGDILLSKVDKASQSAFETLIDSELQRGHKRNIFNQIVLMGLLNNNTQIKMLPNYYECLARLNIVSIQAIANNEIDNVFLENKIDY